MVTSSNWRSVFPDSGNNLAALSERLATTTNPSVYNRSVQESETRFFMVREGLERKLVVVGGSASDKFSGEVEQVEDYQVKVCPLTTDNRKALQALFSWLVRRPAAGKKPPSASATGWV